jgi:hypothetical protein
MEFSHTLFQPLRYVILGFSCLDLQKKDGFALMDLEDVLRVTPFVANAVFDYSTALHQHQVSSSGSRCLQILKT